MLRPSLASPVTDGSLAASRANSPSPVTPSAVANPAIVSKIQIATITPGRWAMKRPRVASTGRSCHARLWRERHAAGGMFWFSRKRLPGSYSFFRATSRR